MDDVEAWETYPDHHWLFNKLEVAEKLGYECGPACVPVQRHLRAVIRPIYNLYGMSLGAKVKWLNPQRDNPSIEENGIIPPGYFWCEYLDGPHGSVDYHKLPNGRWEPYHAMLGIIEDQNLRKFKSWERIEVPYEVERLPAWIPRNVRDLNVEWRGDNIIEIHLRTGNDPLHGSPIGEKLIPIFRGDEIPEGEFVSNEQETDYDASGHIKEVREGYIRCR